jgi:hypothetical protein
MMKTSNYLSWLAMRFISTKYIYFNEVYLLLKVQKKVLKYAEMPDLKI